MICAYVCIMISSQATLKGLFPVKWVASSMTAIRVAGILFFHIMFFLCIEMTW